MQLIRTAAVATLPLALLLAGCGITTSGSAEPASPLVESRVVDTGAQQDIRQTDDNGQPLPFQTTFPNRWNSGNDGTPYEPCTAASPTLLRALDLDPTSVQDAASADFQTARGCGWRAQSSSRATIDQFVGNQPRLKIYKEQQTATKNWQPDIAISGRTVAVANDPTSPMCDTFVESANALVITSAAVYDAGTSLPQICDKAIAFTRATIDQMPE